MPHRLSAFALSLVLAVLPVAVEICEVRCSEHLAHEAAHAAISHHHHTAISPLSTVAQHQVSGSAMASNQTVTMTAVLRGCVQLEAVANESREILRKPVAGRVTATASLPQILITVRPYGDADTQTAHPAPSRSISQLRI